MKKVSTEISEKEALSRLATLCSQGEHCTFEMLEKMSKWGVSEDAQARVMEYLTENKFVDDERYARAFSLDKVRYNKWGRRKVEQALWMKRIDSDIRQRVLDDIDDEEYLRVLRPLLKSKQRSIKAANDYERTTKLIRFAMGRGFGMNIIRRCIDGADEVDVSDEDVDIDETE